MAARRERFERQRTQVAFVHPGTEEQAASVMARYGLDDLPRVSDPKGDLYQSFGLTRGSWRQIMGPRVWWQGLRTLLRGHLPARPTGDVRLMPGLFLLHRDRILWSFRHRTTGDIPDYDACAAHAASLDAAETGG